LICFVILIGWAIFLPEGVATGEVLYCNICDKTEDARHFGSIEMWLYPAILSAENSELAVSLF